MSDAGVEVFTFYFGVPGKLYAVFALLLFVVAGIAWMLICIKAFKERGGRRDEGGDVALVWVVLRGLMLLLILTAIFTAAV